MRTSGHHELTHSTQFKSTSGQNQCFSSHFWDLKDEYCRKWSNTMTSETETCFPSVYICNSKVSVDLNILNYHMHVVLYVTWHNGGILSDLNFNNRENYVCLK